LPDTAKLGIKGITSALKMQPFKYYHEGVWKLGYYDPATRVFLGRVGTTITTVFKTSQNYINNLMSLKP
jgi:hypothetical protein